MGRHKQAEGVARKVLEQDPASSLAYGLLALALALGAQHRWRESLEVADEGLALVPEDEDCINVRAVALIQLGEVDAADGALASALHRYPENPNTHRNIAWQALRGGDAQRDVTHYREALRLAPEDSAAREGLVEALKPRNIVYRLFLRTVLFLTKVPPRTAMAIFLGSVVARMVLQ